MIYRGLGFLADDLAPRPPPSHLSSEQVVSLKLLYESFQYFLQGKIALLFSFSLYVDFLLVFHGHTEEASSTVTQTQLQTHTPTSYPLHLPSADIQTEPEYDNWGYFSDN